MNAAGRRWVGRFSWAALAVPASAVLTAIVFGLVYGVSLTPAGSRNAVFMGFAAVVSAGGLLGLAWVLYDFRTEGTEPSVPVREIAVAFCVAATIFVGWIALKDQALHERGRPVRAVVTALKDRNDPDNGGMEAILADASHHPLGAIGAGNLAVGDHITVTVDPQGRYGVIAGPPPPGNPEWLWTLSALIAVVQALLVASIGFSAARAREPRPRRAR